MASSALYAQGGQFGGQARADAASQMIVLGVQQGISSLPPTSGQSFTYAYDAELGAFKASEQLGPTMFRSAQTIGNQKLSLRVAGSYFELSETFDPINYFITPSVADPQGPSGYAKFGLNASANVILINIGATYGLTDRFELMLNVPVTVVDAKASQVYTTFPGDLSLPPSQRSLAGAGSIEQLDNLIARGDIVLADSSFSALGFDFNSGKNAGVGRISVGAKGVLLTSEWALLSAQTEFFANSPSQDEFSGSDSPAILPRLIGELRPAKHLRFHTDAGYDYDFDQDKLRRFVWNAGFSFPLVNVTFDFGVGGSKFDSPIRWTPPQAEAIGPPTALYPDGVPLSVTAVNSGATKLGTNFIDFLGGLKFTLFEGTVLSGGVNVPITDDGFRAAAVGTAAIEYYF